MTEHLYIHRGLALIPETVLYARLPSKGAKICLLARNRTLKSIGNVTDKAEAIGSNQVHDIILICAAALMWKLMGEIKKIGGENCS